ncbi:GNAT family N-acetyltransferase [Roseovarius sp. MMSF_3350]|uniref:GNAT family N-acetyltransferase n=1 Tax=Roseovarius sp. MMSF_3350 TaxID=3046706 RepID=UPI00273E5F78|nr:GNAT family N-acetyltransferase [Roseovarius sp. MMSF_3350]
MIRHATRRDVPEMVRMGQDFVATCGVPLPFDPVYATHVLNAQIDAEDRLAFVLHLHGRAVGMLCACVVTSPLAPALFAQEQVFWIDPDHRGGKWALGLIRAYVTWAKKEGCFIASMSAIGDNRAAALYERCEFKPADTNYLRVF